MKNGVAEGDPHDTSTYQITEFHPKNRIKVMSGNALNNELVTSLSGNPSWIQSSPSLRSIWTSWIPSIFGSEWAYKHAMSL